jgi:hypothetical protein
MQTWEVMKNTIALLASATLTIFAVAACEKESPETVVVSENGRVLSTSGNAGDPDKVVVVKETDLMWRSAESAIRSQLAAANSEDVDTYVSYVHPDSVDFSDARARAEKVFADNDLRTTLESLDADSVSEGEVKARFVQRTEKLSGLEFRNNRITGVHVMRKDGDMWKIYSTRMDKVDYLDQVP